MLQKLKSKLIEKVSPKYELSETENLIKDVLELMLKNEGTDAISAPITQRYYVSNPNLGYYIKITEYSVTITNHKFTFQEALSEKFKEILLNLVREYMENSRNIFEKTVFDNQIELLKNIKKNLEN